MPARLPSLLAEPPPSDAPLWLENARFFDGIGATVRDGVSVLIEDGRIARLAKSGESGAGWTHAPSISAGGRSYRG